MRVQISDPIEKGSFEAFDMVHGHDHKSPDRLETAPWLQNT